MASSADASSAGEATAINRAVAMPRPARASSWEQYQVQAARRMVMANPANTYVGTVPDVLLAVPVLERPPRKSFLWGAGLGAGLWAIGMIGLLPKHRASGPAGWRATGPAQMVNVLAHLLYGLSVQLAAREVWTKTRTQRPARVG